MTTSPAENRHYRLRGGESWRSPWEDYRWLRDNDPVHRCEHPAFGEFFVLSRFADVFDAARDTATFSSAQGLTLDPDVMKLFEGRAAPIVMMDPPEHTATTLSLSSWRQRPTRSMPSGSWDSCSPWSRAATTRPPGCWVDPWISLTAIGTNANF